MVGVCLAVESGEGFYLPLAHVDEFGQPRDGQLDLPAVVERLRPVLADPSVLKIGHNIKYDMAVMARYGVNVTPIDDSMLISYVLEGGAHGHGMDELCELHLEHCTIKFNDVAGSGKSQVTFDHVPLDKALAYAAEGADVAVLYVAREEEAQREGISLEKAQKRAHGYMDEIASFCDNALLLLDYVVQNNLLLATAISCINNRPLFENRSASAIAKLMDWYAYTTRFEAHDVQQDQRNNEQDYNNIVMHCCARYIGPARECHKKVEEALVAFGPVYFCATPSAILYLPLDSSAGPEMISGVRASSISTLSTSSMIA